MSALEPTCFVSLFEHLKAQASCRQTIPIMRALLHVCAADTARLKDFTRVFVDMDFTAHETCPLEMDCVVVPLSAAPHWRVLLSACQQPAIEHEGLGRLLPYRWPEGRGVEQKGFGVVLAQRAHRFLCMVEEPATPHPTGRMRNLFGLAQLITAEVLARQHLMFVHAGGCGLDGRCLLLTGPSGAGKTTQALRLAREGATFYGDDQIVVGRQADDGPWTAWPYWRNVGITPATAQLCPWLPRPDKEDVGGEKFFFSAGRTFNFTKPGPAQIEAIAWLSPTEDKPRRLGREAALACLGRHFLSAPWTEGSGHALGALCGMAEEIPVYIMPRDQLSVTTWKRIIHDGPGVQRNRSSAGCP
jgi:hypothetical protein